MENTEVEALRQARALSSVAHLVFSCGWRELKSGFDSPFCLEAEVVFKVSIGEQEKVPSFAEVI